MKQLVLTTALYHLKRSELAQERMFEVIIPQTGNKPSLLYPKTNGKKSLALMETMTKRGFKPIARTTANGITEELTTEEMRESVI
jgi:hypothetical protein